MAAGHRPCATCRRPAFAAFKAAWAKAHGPWPGVQQVDATLHAARAQPGARGMRYDRGPARDLPEGALYAHEGRFWLRQHDHGRAYAPDGYGPPVPLPAMDVTVFTCAPLRATLAAGYAPATHPSAAFLG